MGGESYAICLEVALHNRFQLLHGHRRITVGGQDLVAAAQSRKNSKKNLFFFFSVELQIQQQELERKPADRVACILSSCIGI